MFMYLRISLPIFHYMSVFICVLVHVFKKVYLAFVGVRVVRVSVCVTARNN